VNSAGDAPLAPRRSLGAARGGWLSVAFALLGLAFAGALVAWALFMAQATRALPSPPITNGVFLVGTIALVGAARSIGSRAWGQAYSATLIAIAPVVPFLAAIAIFFLYVRHHPGPHADPLFLGLASALGTWVLAGPPLMWMAQADKAQSRSYGEVVQRSARAAARLHWIRDQPDPSGGRPDIVAQAESYLVFLHGELGNAGQPGAGFRYANATGYINLWRALHRLEESLILLVPRPEAFAAAMYDSLRIAGIPNAGKLIEKVNNALAAFGDAAAPAICDPAVTPLLKEASQPAALAVLLEVRHALNVHQDDTWERLIRQRNRLLRTVLVTSVVGLLLVSLAVSFAVSRDTLGAAAVFYLVGALIGLFARLRGENKAGPAVDDYGLFEARLLATLLLSGLASLVGVVLIAFVPTLLATGTAPNPVDDLAKVFTLAGNARGLVAAAVFGLTPELVTGWLSKQSEDIMAELASASPAKGNVAPPEQAAPR
jgi:hypothetical protein